MSFTIGKEVIEELKRTLGLDERIQIIIKLWNKEIGSLAKYVDLVGIQNGKLLVEVTSSSHFQELNLKKRSIIKNINQYFGNEKIVKDIKLKLKK